jgi:sugar transferase EpsL
MAWRPASRRSALDFVVAPVLAVLAIPVLAILGALVRLRIGSPIFFRQARAGLGGIPFEIVKFRTMSDARDANGKLLPDDARMTRLGSRLRALSLDELPELWNVMRGDMSLIGPRPLPISYLHRYSDEETRRHEVRPGISGWAQVNGRNGTTWEERLSMDVWYVDHRSLRLDLMILFKTIASVIRRSGINAPGHATMPELRPDSSPQA